MDRFVHWSPLFTLHLDRFVPRDDAKRRQEDSPLAV